MIMTEKDKKVQKSAAVEKHKRGTITFYADPMLKKEIREAVKTLDMNVSQFIRKLLRKEFSKKIRPMDDGQKN